MVACVFISVFCWQLGLSPVGGAASHASIPLLLSHSTITWYTKPYPTMSYHTKPYQTITWYTKLYPTMSYHRCNIILCDASCWLVVPHIFLTASDGCGGYERSTLECWPALVAPATKHQTQNANKQKQKLPTKHQYNKPPNTPNTKLWHQPYQQPACTNNQN